MIIDSNKQYTCGGHPARIICTDRRDLYCVVALVSKNGSEVTMHFDINGQPLGVCDEPLIEAKPRIQRELWMNI